MLKALNECGTFNVINCAGFKYMLKLVGTKPIACTPRNMAKKTYFMIVLTCLQNIYAKNLMFIFFSSDFLTSKVIPD